MSRGSARFEGRCVVVTGGASGIGKATAVRFMDEGARVAIIDKSPGGCTQTLKELRGRGYDPLVLTGDVSRSNEVKTTVRRVMAEFERVDILFNNAGILVEGTVEDVSEEDWDRIMAVNVKGVFLMSKEVVPIMLKQGQGAIVNTASCSGLVGDRNAVPYNTSKGAVVLMTKCMALDYAQRNIRVNCVCPGEIETPMFVQEAKGRGVPLDRYRRMLSEQHPVGRLGRSEEVADAVLFLASDDASFITGAAFSVDGGYTSQ